MTSQPHRVKTQALFSHPTATDVQHKQGACPNKELSGASTVTTIHRGQYGTKAVTQSTNTQMPFPNSMSVAQNFQSAGV
jgi:hypothetical protein